MKLYYLPGACSLGAHISLRETGLPFEIDKVDGATKKTAGGEDLMKLNPKGYVPTIKLDDGSIMCENGAVLQYIADQNPAAGLAPASGTMARYRLQEWLTFIGTELHKTFSPLFRKDVAPEVKTRAFELLTRRFSYVERQLTDTPYLMGATFTVADAHMFAIVRWCSRVGYDLAPFPKLTEYFARISARPTVQAAMKAEGLIQ